MVMVFEQGDIVYLDFDPQAGHEQRGRRPGVDLAKGLLRKRRGMSEAAAYRYIQREAERLGCDQEAAAHKIIQELRS